MSQLSHPGNLPALCSQDTIECHVDQGMTTAACRTYLPKTFQLLHSYRLSSAVEECCCFCRLAVALWVPLGYLSPFAVVCLFRNPSPVSLFSFWQPVQSSCMVPDCAHGPTQTCKAMQQLLPRGLEGDLPVYA